MAIATTKKRGILRVGTSGIALPGSKQTFPLQYRDKSRLNYYASLFNSIEINSTFYKVPQNKTLLRWADDVTPGFQFTVKLWKELTHVKDLAFKLHDADMFMQRIKLPAKQQGCLLIQFPGKITFSYREKVAALLQHIYKINADNRWRLAVEFRHTSWYNTTTYNLLDQCGMALVLHDMPASALLSVETKTDFIYRRFHGVAGNYRGDYGKDYLKKVAQQADKWLATGKDVYLYFNNTMGDAFGNAMFINKLLNG